MENVEPIHLFILIGAAQGFLMSCLLLLKKSQNRRVNIFLGLGFLMLSVRLFVYPFAQISQGAAWQLLNSVTLLILLSVVTLPFMVA